MNRIRTAIRTAVENLRERATLGRWVVTFRIVSGGDAGADESLVVRAADAEDAYWRAALEARASGLPLSLAPVWIHERATRTDWDLTQDCLACALEPREDCPDCQGTRKLPRFLPLPNCRTCAGTAYDAAEDIPCECVRRPIRALDETAA